MVDKKVQNCWEYWNCELEVKEKCPAFLTNSGTDCWDVARSHCPKSKRPFLTCWECEWFQKLNPNFDKE